MPDTLLASLSSTLKLTIREEIARSLVNPNKLFPEVWSSRRPRCLMGFIARRPHLDVGYAKVS